MTNKKNKITLLAIFSLILLPFSVESQTGPGGVGTPLTVGYWIDVESNGGVDGTSVSVMKDYSAGGIDAVQTVVSRQPEFQTNIVNGRSALYFDGNTNLVSAGHSVLDGASYLDYYVFGDISYSGVTIPFNLDYGSGNYNDFRGLLTLSGTMRVYGRNGVTGTGSKRATIGSPAGFNLFEGVKDGSSMVGKLNYSTVNTNTATTVTPALNEGVNLGGRDLASGALRMTGHISEAFVFTASLNTAEVNILQNYLAAKYNSTVAVDMYDYELDYGLGVVGIGRDDAANEHVNSIGNGIVRIEKTGGLSDGDYLFIGHDGGSLSLLSTNVPAVMIGGSRYKRIWRMDEPTDIGGIDITFELDAVTDFSGDPANYRLLIDNVDDDFSSVSQILVGTYSAIDQTVTFANVDLDAGAYFSLGGDTPTDIESISTGLWNMASTWDCGCIPSIYNNVTIKPSHAVIVAGNAFVKELTVDALGVLAFASAGKLELKEDLTINGSVSSVNDGEVVFSGTVLQTVDLNSQTIVVSDLTVDNLMGVNMLNGGFSVNDTYSPLNGDFDVTNGHLTILSSGATTTGRVGEMGPNASVTGDVTVERFIASGLAGNRNLSSPVIGADLSEWDADILISGTGFPDGCAYSSTTGCYFSVKKFQGGDLGTSYIDVTDPNEVLVNMTGYEVFLGDNATTFSGATLKSTGSLNGPADILISSAPTKWNLVGNPYASPISFQNVDRNRFDNYFYIFDAASGSYQWYDGSSNTSSIATLADGKIAIGQGFWTYVIPGAGNFMRFKQTTKISANATFIRDNEVENGLQLTLKQDNSTFFNVTSLSFDENSNDLHDDLDIPYLSTGLEMASSLYMYINDSVQLAKNYLSDDGQKKVVDFRMNCKTDSYYTISPSNLEDIQNYSNVYIFDKFLNLMVDLKKEGSYTFHSKVGEQDRFSVILSNDVLSDKTYISGANIESENSISVKQIGHSLEFFSAEGIENGSVEITNVVGQKIVTDFILDNTGAKQYLTINNNHSGIFIVVVRSAGQVVATKKIIL